MASPRTLVAVLAGCLVCAGCYPGARQSFFPFEAKGPGETSPTAPVTNLLATWRNEVMYLPNITNQGRPFPTLVGRLFLLGGDSGHPLRGDGEVCVDVYDVSDLPAGEQPSKRLPGLRVDPDNLKKLCQKDLLGFGYTLLLPWDYPPTIRQVALMVSYHPKNGTPLYASSSTITFSTTPLAATARQGAPAPSAPPPPGQTGPRNPEAGSAVRQEQVFVPSPSATPPDAARGAPAVLGPPATTPNTGIGGSVTRIPLPTSRSTAFGNLVPQTQ